MKTLILTMTCGEGHNAIARSLKTKFDNFGECEIFDIFNYSNFVKNLNNKGYLFLTKHFPKIYQFFWDKERVKISDTRKKGNAYLSVKKAIISVRNKIEDFKPDVVMSTHNYASNIISYLKSEKEYNFLSGTVVFDYCLCPYWGASVLNDFVFTPSNDLEPELEKVGFKKSQIYNYGFPSNPKFEKNYDKDTLKEKMNYDKNDFIVLSMAGGFGQGNQLELLKNLDLKGLNKNKKFIIVCGRNVKQYNLIKKYIEKNEINNVELHGFVNNVEELMAISDLIFTRGSGNNLTECFHSNLVPIIREKMLVNEKINKKYFIDKNMAFGLDNIKDAGKFLNYIFENKNLIIEKKENIKNFVINNSVDKIVNVLLEEYSKKRVG